MLHDPGIGARSMPLARIVDQSLERALGRANALDWRHLPVLDREDGFDPERRPDPRACRSDSTAAAQELERVDREPHLQLGARLVRHVEHTLRAFAGRRTARRGQRDQAETATGAERVEYMDAIRGSDLLRGLAGRLDSARQRARA